MRARLRSESAYVSVVKRKAFLHSVQIFEGPPRLTFKEQRGWFPRCTAGPGMKQISDLHTAQRLRMSAARPLHRDDFALKDITGRPA